MSSGLGSWSHRNAVLSDRKAAIEVLVTVQEPAGPMKKEATEAGFFSSTIWHKQYPRLQIYTVAELLAGRQVERPPTAALDETYKRAPKAKPQSPRAAGAGVVSRRLSASRGRGAMERNEHS